MTREQAAQLVAILVAHYPNAKFTRENAQAWTDELQALDAEKTHAAVKALVRTEKWMPSLAHIFELVAPKREYAAPYHRPFPPEPDRPLLPAKVVAMATRKPLGENEQRRAEQEQARQRELVARLIDETAAAAKGAT